MVDNKLIRGQAGIKPGKSFSSQILNLIEFIKSGYENKKITGVAFIDLTVADDTIDDNLLLEKLYIYPKDYKLIRIVEINNNNNNRNRRIFVVPESKKSRWTTLKNGFSQGSILAPIFYNIYTNDQPIPTQLGAKSFISTDNITLAIQRNNFEEVESKMETSFLIDLLDYY